jgi:hypothetical protein
LEAVPGSSPLWVDLASSISLAHDSGLQVALRPQAHTPIDMDQWWTDAPKNQIWWDDWFETYRRFVLNFADLGANQNAEVLILGGEGLDPAMPGGTIADGTPAGTPFDAETRWRDLITEVKTRYGGRIAWAIPYPKGIETPPPFLDAVDEIYVLWAAPLANQSDASATEMEAEVGRLLDSEVLTFQVALDKPIIISVAYPSADAGITGCLPTSGEGCLDPEAAMRPGADLPGIALDLGEQVDAYSALLSSVHQRSWISGFVSRGYYPPVALRDKSISVHGKPAADLLGYWYAHWLGVAP